MIAFFNLELSVVLSPSARRWFGFVFIIRTKFLKLTSAQQVIDFRNLLTHRYDAVSNDEVWKIIQVYLEPLLKEVAATIESVKT